MRYFDCHSHFSTKAGLHHATQEDYEQAQRVFKRKRTFETEEQMADGFRQRKVRTILDIYRTWRMTDEDEIRASNDYAADFARKNSDVVYGNWLAANPAMKDFWLKEYARLAAKKSGFLGFCQSKTARPSGKRPLGLARQAVDRDRCAGADHDRQPESVRGCRAAKASSSRMGTRAMSTGLRRDFLS
jgi:hypothetical protein